MYRFARAQPGRKKIEKKMGKIKCEKYEKMNFTKFLTSKNQHFAIFTPTNYHLLNFPNIFENIGEKR